MQTQLKINPNKDDLGTEWLNCSDPLQLIELATKAELFVD